MPQLAAAQGSVFAAKLSKRLHVRENFLLVPGAATA